MQKKMIKPFIRTFPGIFLTLLIVCALPPHKAEAAAGIEQISLGCLHSAALKEDGSLWLWGRNEDGELGNGSDSDSSTPVKVMTSVKQVSLGGNHSAALKKDGSLWLWGNNWAGQLGNGSDSDSSKPVKVMTGVRQVSLGYEHSAALKKNGSLWLWGRNEYGELGNGSGSDSSIPVKITLPGSAAKINASRICRQKPPGKPDRGSFLPVLCAGPGMETSC